MAFRRALLAARRKSMLLTPGTCSSRQHELLADALDRKTNSSSQASHGPPQPQPQLRLCHPALPDLRHGSAQL
jgi:hypothetical protein